MLTSAQNPHMPAMPQSNLHLDILMGRDEILDTPDFMGCAYASSHYLHCVSTYSTLLAPVPAPSMDIHRDMEKKLRM
jgi:proteasome maturation protein